MKLSDKDMAMLEPTLLPRTGGGAKNQKSTRDLKHLPVIGKIGGFYE
jgi:hypothetical protein